MDAFFVGVIFWSLLVGVLGNDSEGETRISNGEGSSMINHPEMVSIHFRGFFLCAGLIYNARTIITTATCATRIDLETGKSVIRAGNLRLSQKDSTEQTIAVNNKKIHPKYRKNLSDYNIAVLLLESSLEWNIYVQKVNIPVPWKEKKLIKYNLCGVAGWGYLDDKRVPWKIQVAPVFIYGRNECQKYLDYFNSKLKLTWRMMCSAGYDKGPCPGDFGGPLTCFDSNGEAYHLGVAAAYTFCGSAFGVYTRLTKFRTWLAAINN